jgi:hypothetical protein
MNVREEILRRGFLLLNGTMFGNPVFVNLKNDDFLAFISLHKDSIKAVFFRGVGRISEGGKNFNLTEFFVAFNGAIVKTDVKE